MSGIDRKNEGNAGRRLCTVRHCRSESVGKVENQREPRGLFQGPSAKLGSWRKAKKARTSSTIGHFHPPFRQLRQLAERVEFPEKKAPVCQFRAPIWRRGPNFPRFLATACLMLVDAQDVGR